MLQYLFQVPCHQNNVCELIINEDEEISKARDYPLKRLICILPKIMGRLITMEWDFQVFGLKCHVPFYITIVEALKVY